MKSIISVDNQDGSFDEKGFLNAEDSHEAVDKAHKILNVPRELIRVQEED